MARKNYNSSRNSGRRGAAPRKAKSNSKAQNHRASSMVFLAAGVGIGLLMAAFFFFKNEGKSKLLHLKDAATQHHATHHRHAAKRRSAQQNEPHFDFYTALPNMKVDVPGEEETKSTTNTAPQNVKSTQQNVKADVATDTANDKDAVKDNEKTTETKATQQYIIQVASLRDFQDADALKAELILSGNTVNVLKINNHGRTWYRVLVGPFASHQTADAKVKELRAAHHQAIVLRAEG